MSMIVIIVLKLKIDRMLSSTENRFFKKEASLPKKDEEPRDYTDPKHNKNYKYLGNDIFP
jgi:hypothetical protein